MMIHQPVKNFGHKDQIKVIQTKTPNSQVSKTMPCVTSTFVSLVHRELCNELKMTYKNPSSYRCNCVSLLAPVHITFTVTTPDSIQKTWHYYNLKNRGKYRHIIQILAHCWNHRMYIKTFKRLDWWYHQITWELWATKTLSCLQQNNAQEDDVFSVN